MQCYLMSDKINVIRILLPATLISICWLRMLVDSGLCYMAECLTDQFKNEQYVCVVVDVFFIILVRNLFYTS